MEKEEEKLKKTENTIAVMTMLKDGTVPETISTSGESQGDTVTHLFIKNSIIYYHCCSIIFMF